MEGVEWAELRPGVHLGRDVARLEAVDLVERDHDRNVETEDARSDETVTGADPLSGREHEEDGLDFLERGVDRVLHALGQRVERPLEAREVGEHELVVLAVRDAEDAPAGRLRLVRDDRDLAAAECVHERRLADVGTARDGDDSRPHSSSPIQGATRPHSVT